MENTFLDPSTSFLIAAGLGFCFSLIYDVFRILRLLTKPKAVAIFIEDIIFALICAILTFGLLLVRCNGEIRWFIFAGELCGFLTCRLTLSRLIYSMADLIIKFIKTIFRMIKKYIWNPIMKLKLKINIFIIACFKKILNILKKALKTGITIVYNKLKYNSFVKLKVK